MSTWKLIRQTYGNEEYTFTEGDEVLVGRAFDNTITLSSIVISRIHCVLNAHRNAVVITDLKSSNGVYVGPSKIPRDTPHTLKESDIIGIGWSPDANLADVKDSEKYVFKLTKQNDGDSVKDRIQFQSENEFDDIEDKIAELEVGQSSKKSISPVFNSKLSLKRKSNIPLNDIKVEIKEEKRCRIVTMDDDIVNLLSESDSDVHSKWGDDLMSNVKTEPENKPCEKEALKDQIKCENGYLEYEAFNVKQEYLGYDDEPILVDSESDSESEHWYLRLSQNSPGKPFMKVPKEREVQEDSSYSQMDDDFISDSSFINQGEEVNGIPSQPPEVPEEETDPEDMEDDLITLPPEVPPVPGSEQRDEIDGYKAVNISPQKSIQESNEPVPSIETKRMQIIEPHIAVPKSKTKHTSKSTSSLSKSHKHKKQSSRRHISNSQKEERKRRLKELTFKGKEGDADTNKDTNSSTNKTSVVKVTSSNRGAFLTDAVSVVKPVEKKAEPKAAKTKHNSIDEPSKRNEELKDQLSPENNTENKKKHSSKKEDHKSSKHNKHSTSHRSSKRLSTKTKSNDNKPAERNEVKHERIPLKSLKPLTESDETVSKKPFSKVEPMPPEPPKKKKKKVRFSEVGPEVREFEIEPGNKMRKTSSIKTALVDIRQMPIFSLEKITLMKILRWNPHWLEEQINNNDPPPILGHNNPPMSIFHSFSCHSQYVQMIGDLLLMEIWECLTLAYMKIRSQTYGITMRIDSLPPIPLQERTYELFSLSVNITLPSNDTRNVPRVGEILLVDFGPEDARNQRFFFVHNVRTLPSPPNNIHTFYCISLYTTYTEKMKTLRVGELMVGRTLAYINKELNLFEAMEYLAGSPLNEVILRPETRHFMKDFNPSTYSHSQWTKTLNPSQQEAVSSSVAAALGDKPSIQMVQGPPGTGKSSVICSIVMTYFYDEQGKRLQNRGKILICATSNAAVDELVIRLLDIRQRLPKTERFRMVRAGRAESMAARARDVSAQQLAQRDAARARTDHPQPRNTLATKEEISHLQAKINMWKTATQDAKDPVRVAYCQGRVSDLLKRINLVRLGGGGCVEEQTRPEQLAAAERRIIEGADIVLTTLASAHNHKMRGLKGRIALCIVDEAGQAIEPETLIPLTLDVTRLTLIGDPQQLPGYICSQRAKKHGLGESLFSRLANVQSAALLLSVQYRMHADIADYPNRAFYGARVSCAALARPALPLPPYALLAIASGDRGQGASGANEMEACGVSRVAAALASVLRPLALSLAVITPYNAHKELIKKYLRMLQQPSEPAVEVNTVDSFQGQERDVVVVSLARSHGVGFLTDAGRMNVMLTRARHALLVCLNPHAMMKNNQWRTLVEDAQRRKMYKTLPNRICQTISTGEGVHEDVLKYIHT